MKVYILNNDGTLNFEYDCPKSPLSDDYLMPSIAYTDVSPPPNEAGKVAVFEGNQWVQKVDNRGTKYWLNGEEFEILEIGLSVPNGATLTKPLTPEQVFEQIRRALQGVIDAKAWELGKFTSGNSLILYAGYPNAFQQLALQFATWEAQVWFEADQYSKQVLAGTKPIPTPEQAVAMMPAYPSE